MTAPPTDVGGAVHHGSHPFLLSDSVLEPR